MNTEILTTPVNTDRNKGSKIARYFSKMKGTRRTTALTAPSTLDVFIVWLGAFMGIGTVSILSIVYQMPMMVASFGATAVLIYGVPDVPLAQPRNVIGGHIISAVTGVLIHALFGLTWWSAALATASSIVLMLITRTTHPPGGATALAAILTLASPIYILTPVTLGAVILVAVALFINNLSPNRRYPRYWI